MKRFTVLFPLLVFTLLSFAGAHKFYVSVTQIEYVQDQESLQIITKIFIDDFERLIRERYDETITLAEKNEPESVNFYVEKYIKEKLQIDVNGEPVTLQFIGKQYDNDIMECFFEVTDLKSIESIEVKSSVLFDLFEEQQNIVRLKVNGKNKSFMLIKENPKGLLNFN